MIPVKENKATTLEIKNFDGIPFYQITNHDKMPAFFMTILSPSNHWMFISSNGALSAGRKNADYALFPYYTEDKITESVENTGCKTIIKGIYNQESFIWEPFSTNQQTTFSICRNLYKSVYGNQIIFEEINETLQITFRYQWSNSEQFGFVRKATLDNWSTKTYDLVVLDGLQNILPAGVGSDLQNFYSNLVDAYKSSELVEEVSLGIYALSAEIVDRAEPSEALKANTVWSFGLENSKILLSVNQLEHFKTNQNIFTENENKRGKGAYFLGSVRAVFILKMGRLWVHRPTCHQSSAAAATSTPALTFTAWPFFSTNCSLGKPPFPLITRSGPSYAISPTRSPRSMAALPEPSTKFYARPATKSRTSVTRVRNSSRPRSAPPTTCPPKTPPGPFVWPQPFTPLTWLTRYQYQPHPIRHFGST